jgi:lipid II:glycine glycyltransferase (peptidoglycan interpeptide bridge formation enzyme)
MLSDNYGEYSSAGFVENEYFTILLGLSQKTEEIWSGLSQNARRGVKKAEKSGVQVREAQSWKDWRDFHDLHYLHSRKRGIAVKSLDFFDEVFRNFVPKNMAKLFLTEDSGTINGGALFLTYGGVLIYYIGASDDQTKYSPHDILFWNAITWANKNGYRIFDLGDTWPDPNSHLYTIHAFKMKWGGRVVRSSHYVKGRMYMLGRRLILNASPIQRIYESLHERMLI